MSELRFAKPKADIELNANINIHNRFDFVIEEKGKPLREFTLGDKDEFTVQGTDVLTAQNVILNNMWTRLVARNTFGGYIHLGTGSGTPASTDTNLFTRKLARQWTTDAQVRGFDTDGVTPLGYWRGYITISDTEENGTIFTEVGVGYGTTSGYLVTHAMLKDAEGGTTSITKNSSMVLKVYATIYATVTTSDSYTVLQHPSSNTLLSYMTGGAAPTMVFNISSGRANTSAQKFCDAGFNQPSNSASKTLTMNGNAGTKKIVGTPATFSRTEGLINSINSVGLTGVGMVNMNKLDNPNFAGVPVVDEVIGTGDGERTIFSIPALNAEPLTANHYLASVAGMSGYVLGDVCTGTIGGVEFTVKSIDLNFASISCTPAFGDTAINGSVALSGGTGTGAVLTIETVSAPYSSTHNDLGMTVHSNALPCYRGDNYNLNFMGIANWYFPSSSLIKDLSGNYKSYLIKSNSVVARMFNGQQWEASYSILNYATCFSPDGFGADDGYALNFVSMKMRTGLFDGSSFFFDPTEVDIVLDTAMPEPIIKVYVYSGRKFMFVTDQYVAMYQQTSRNEFMRLWIVQNTNLSLKNKSENRCSHVYANGKLWSENPSDLPSTSSWNALVYDTTLNKYVVTASTIYSEGSNLYAIGEYDNKTQSINWSQYEMPSTMTWNALIYDAKNKIYVVTCGTSNASNVYAVGKYNVLTNQIDWVSGTMPSHKGWNALIYDSTNDVYVATCAGAANYAVGEYNEVTGLIDWNEYAMPSNKTWRPMIYDDVNEIYIVVTTVASYAVGKYNSSTKQVDWVEYSMPSSQTWKGLVYDKTDNLYVVVGQDSAVYAIGSYNSGTGTIDWTQYTMPSSSRWNPVVYSAKDGIFVVTTGGGTSRSYNIYATGKYNAGTGQVDWSQGSLPLSRSWSALIYDSVNDVFVATCGDTGDTKTTTYSVGRYGGERIGWSCMGIKCQNVSDGSIIPNPTDYLSALPDNNDSTSFAVMDDQFLLGSDTTPRVKYVYNFPAVQAKSKYVYHHADVQSMPCTSTPDWDKTIMMAKNEQYFYGQPGPNRQVGASSDTNVQYYSDCIIKANNKLISAETSIADGASYVEFDTPPANGETVKLSYLSRGLNKINLDNKYYTVTVSAEYVFGEQE